MNSIVAVALQIISFLVSHRDQIIQAVRDIEGLIPEAPGASKAAAVKGFIAAGLGIEAELEKSWGLVSPVFNVLVALVKGKPVPAPTPVPPVA